MRNREVASEVLISAAKKGDVEVVGRLLAAGADVNAANILGKTALMWAARCGYAEVVAALLQHGAVVNAIDNEGITALMWAARCGYAEVAERLLEVDGIDINAADHFDLTALMVAAQGGHVVVVDRLLANGANITATDNNGATAAFWAGSSGHYSVLRRLKTPLAKNIYPAVTFASLGSMAAAVVLLTPGFPMALIVCASVFALLLNELFHNKHYGCSFIGSAFGGSS